MQLEVLYDEHVGKVYKFFYVQSLNKSVAEDLTSQTFTTFISRAKDVVIDDPKKYLYGIMRRVWLEYLRSKYETLATDIDEIDEFEHYVDVHTSRYDNQNVAERLRWYVEQLPEAQLRVLHLRHYEDRSPRQISEQLGKDMNYVKVTYKRALKSLRVLMKSPNVLYEPERSNV